MSTAKDSSMSSRRTTRYRKNIILTNSSPIGTDALRRRVHIPTRLVEHLPVSYDFPRSRVSSMTAAGGASLQTTQSRFITSLKRPPTRGPAQLLSPGRIRIRCDRHPDRTAVGPERADVPAASGAVVPVAFRFLGQRLSAFFLPRRVRPS